MLLITFAICFASYYNLNFQRFQVNNLWCFYTFLGISFGIVLVIQCCGQDFRGSNPLNLILLAIFTICYSYIISFFTSIYANAYGAPLVLEAMFFTIALVLALTVYAFIAKIDFGALAGILIVVILAFILFGLSFAFTLSPVLHTLYMTLGIIVGGIIIVYDTILIADGERGCSLDDPVFGALILYLDIIRIFLYILMAMGKRK